MHMMENKEQFKMRIQKARPLVHCITNHISILDCANLVLALHGQPIMAEHPDEMTDVTAQADVLVCNLGNISDRRMEAILKAGAVANERGICSLLDLVGVGTSNLRREFAKKCVEQFHPAVIKGNMSEIKAFCGLKSHAKGVDAGIEDQIREGGIKEAKSIAMQAALTNQCTVVVSGKYDIVTDGRRSYVIYNGCAEMSRITGTGCMLNVVMATFAGACVSTRKQKGSELIPVLAYAAAMFGICGEEALKGYPVGTGRMRLFDSVDRITDDTIQERMRVAYEENI